jgi:uncharacterized membrane protein (DUF106 family)
MQTKQTKFVSKATLAVDAVLTLLFFVYMYGVVSTHVPSRDHHMVLLWGALCSSCLSAVFWLALQMIRVVLGLQRALAKGE